MSRPDETGDRLLLAVARSAAAMLRATRSADALPEVLSLVGEAAAADRTYAHRVAPHPATGRPAISEVAKWNSRDVAQQPRPAVMDAPLSSLSTWLEPLERGEPVQGIARDFPPLERSVMEHFGTVSTLAVPILVGGQLGGTIGLDDCKRERRWERREVSALEALAANLGALWEREIASERAASSEARLRARLEDDARVRGALVTFGNDLIRAQHEPDLPDRLCEWAADLLNAESVYGLLWSDEDDAFFLAGTHGLIDALAEVSRSVRLPADRLSLDELFRTDDLVETKRSAVPLARITRAGGVGCFLLLALRHGGILRGVLSVSRSDVGSPFSDADRRVARGIAQITSLGLENARLLLEHANSSRLKSEFVATMSHELRTPLGVILGYAEILEGEELGPLAAGQRDALGRLSESAQALADLVESTLDLGRIEAGREQLVATSVEIGSLLDEICRSLDLGERAAVDLDAGLRPVRTDERKLDVILRNLLSNAVKFSSDGAIRISAVPSLDGVEIAVADDGIGIPETEIDTIFEAFHQAGDHALGGVGLGLHIVHRLALLLRGTVRVESEPGSGSTFFVSIPNLPSAEP